MSVPPGRQGTSVGGQDVGTSSSEQIAAVYGAALADSRVCLTSPLAAPRTAGIKLPSVYTRHNKHTVRELGKVLRQGANCSDRLRAALCTQCTGGVKSGGPWSSTGRGSPKTLQQHYGHRKNFFLNEGGGGGSF